MGQKNLIMAGAGWSASFLDKLFRRARKGGLSDEALHVLATEKGDDIAEECAEAVARIIDRAANALKNIFRLMRALPATVEELLDIVDGKWTHHTFVNEWINSKNFPLRMEYGGDRTIEFIDGKDFDHDPTSEEVIAEAKKRGLEQPTYEDAFRFDKEHPDLQGWFVFLHEPVVLEGRGHVVYLYRGDAGRDVNLHWFDYRWSRSYRFGFLRKSPAL